jgi:carbon-monoxide dehydrogenase large subunit
MTASEAQPARAAGPSAARFVGQSVKRREDPRLLSGRGRFVDDLRLPGMLHIAFARSDVARGTITRLDVEAARKLPGVQAVFTGADLNPRAHEMWASHLGPPPDTPYPPLNVLAEHEVKFVGDPFALVVAESRYVAEDAVELIEVEIERRPPVLDVETALDKTSELVHEELGTNRAAAIPAGIVPGLEEAFASATHVVTRTFRQARVSNVPMEPRGIAVRWDPYQDEMQIWSATQSPHEVRVYTARMLALADNRVRVVAGDVGGGFGQKLQVTRDESAVIIAGYLLPGRPVKWTEDRKENLVAANQARAESGSTSMAFDAEGHILAVTCHYVEDVGAYPIGGVGTTAGLAMLMLPGPYKIPLVGFSNEAVYTNTCGRAAYRGPWMIETLCREQILDHAARDLGIDPLELRRRNVIAPDELPFTTATGMYYDTVTPSETLEQAVEILDYAAFRSEQAEARRAGRYLGVGISLYIEPSALGFGVSATEQATIRIEPTGKVRVHMGTGSHGHSLETTIPQVVADELGCDIDDVMLIAGDTSATPFGTGTAGSRSAVFAGGAAKQAASIVRDKVLQIAAHMLEANPADLEIVDSVISVRGTPASSVSLVQVATAAYIMPDQLPPGMLPGLEVAAGYRPPVPFTWSNACHVCTCEVAPQTGVVTLLRYVVSEDCGRMINPQVVRGQIAGGVAQGIGSALLEHMVYDADGNPLATTFLDYLLPTAADVPRLEYGHIETLANNNGGWKGMGEGGAIGAPSAVANAVADALAPFAVAPTDFPLGPAQLLRALAKPVSDGP